MARTWRNLRRSACSAAGRRRPRPGLWTKPIARFPERLPKIRSPIPRPELGARPANQTSSIGATVFGPRASFARSPSAVGRARSANSASGAAVIWCAARRSDDIARVIDPAARRAVEQRREPPRDVGRPRLSFGGWEQANARRGELHQWCAQDAAHPRLPSSTFRLQLGLITGRMLLRRLLAWT